MAFVTDTFSYPFPRVIKFPNQLKCNGVLRFVALLAAGALAGCCVITALGTLEAVLPALTPLAPAMSRTPTMPMRQMAIVDQKSRAQHLMRQRFIEAYTADTAYSNLDWRRNKITSQQPIIADIGPGSVISDAPIVEPRQDRVVAAAPMQGPVLPAVIATAANMARIAAAEFTPVVDNDAEMSAFVPVPSNAPDHIVADASFENDVATFLPDDVPFPGVKPEVAKPVQPERRVAARAPDIAEAPEIKRGALRRLFSPATRSRTAIYDISAATVYLPSGEKLEAHSGIGHMRDNPRFVSTKNRGATPPSTYNLRMRESLFHGVEAVRLIPSDGRNPYNRDGLLAHTYMLRNPGDSNGCVVFKDYHRFLRAFKRGEFDKLVVVTSASAMKNERVASIF